MSTLTRADTPTQSPSGELYLLGVWASVEAIDLGQQALVLEVLEGRRVLGVDDVGRGVRTPRSRSRRRRCPRRRCAR